MTKRTVLVPVDDSEVIVSYIVHGARLIGHPAASEQLAGLGARRRLGARQPVPQWCFPHLRERRCLLSESSATRACKTRAGARCAGDELYFLYVVSGTSFNVLGGDGTGARPQSALPAI